MSSLDSLSLGFRSKYLDQAALTAQLQAWHAAYPDLTRLTAIGTTPEGRTLWVLTIGRDPDRVRPTAWVDGNMHASELAGQSVALAIAEDFLALHVEPDRMNVSAILREQLLHVRLFVLPCMSPDGAEAVLTTGRFVRSVPRDARSERGVSRWRSGDLDGDGQIRTLRVVDPTGDYVAAHPDHPNLLTARQVDDPGPYYRVYPEGTIEHWDGFTIPVPSFIGDNPIDLNRNFPWSWAPTHEQIGAGRFPTSEPESRAVVEFACAHPEIFAWLNLHCFGGVFIRPLGHGPDSKMDQTDLGVYRQLDVWAKEFTTYPVVSGFEEFLYAPDQPLHGDLTDFAYHQRGAFAYVVELWDLFKRLELPVPKRFVDYYNQFDRAAQAKLATWDRDHNHSRVVGAWRPIEHPQLGACEIGGIDPRFGVWNPPPELLPDLCASQSACFLRVAGLAPVIVVRSITTTVVADGVARVEVVIDNRGYLPSHGLSSARKLEWNEGLVATLSSADCTLIDPHADRVQLGHLAGWGHGVGVGADDLSHLRSDGNGATARGQWLVRGPGTAVVRIGSTRVGFVDVTVTID
jgi:Zinc carboxypeptidase